MSVKRWIVGQPDGEKAAALAEACNISPFLALLLVTRGICDEEDALDFLSGEIPPEDPFSFADMDAAVDRIQRALDEGEPIAVFGDYDVDGITSTVLLCSFLRDHGGNVCYHIPHREGEGYGLHEEPLRRMAEQGVRLIITVDNGIASVEEARFAASLGMDMVITDHHQPQGQLPDAVAVVDPHRPDCESDCKDYAGVGVAFMLACALEGDMDSVMQRYGDLLALGTLADVMPLRGEIRREVREGLAVLQRRERVGLRKLADAVGVGGKTLTATVSVFSLAPRLNAAGRMGCPEKAAELLFCEDEDRAAELAAEIVALNTERQQIETVILKEVNTCLQAHPEWLSDRVLVIDGRGWHNGVLGILASRLCDRVGKPCVVLSVQEDGSVKGSGRSVRGFSLFDAFTAVREELTAYGGHELAAGVSLTCEHIDTFRRRINEYAAVTAPVMPMPELLIDFRLRPSQIDVEKLEQLSALEPYGAGNPSPVFGLFRMRLDNITAVGGGRHLRLSLSRDGAQVTAMKFNTSQEEFPVPCGSLLDLAVTLDVNEYRGVITPSIIVKDLRYADTDGEQLLAAYAGYDSILRGEPQAAGLLPDRAQMADVYRALRGAGRWYGTLEQLQHALGGKLSFLQTRIAVELLRQAGLLDVLDSGELLSLRVLETSGKVDLYTTPIALALS